MGPEAALGIIIGLGGTTLLALCRERVASGNSTGSRFELDEDEDDETPGTDEL